MTPKEAEARVKEIYETRVDDEMAHSAEDALRREVLEHIANGGRNARRLAEIALRTEEINFARWCA